MAARTPPSKRLGRPRAVDSATTHERLLRAARDVFAEHGFAGTTNRMIAEAAGLTTAAIYHYADSKMALYAQVYGDMQRLVSDMFDKSLIGRVGLVEQMAAVLDAAVTLNRDDASLAAFLAGAHRQVRRDPVMRNALAGLSMTADIITRLVGDAVANGELAASDARAVADMFGAAMSGLTRFASITGDLDRHEAAVESFKRLMAGTLLQRGQNP